MRFIACVDNWAPVHRVDADQNAEKICSLRDLKNPWANRRTFPLDPHCACAGEDLACDKKWNDITDDSIPGDIPAHEIVVMASVTMPNEVGIVLIKADLSLRQQLFVSPTRTLTKDALPSFLLRHNLPQRGALGRRVLRMGVVVVKTCAVAEYQVALDLLETQRAILVDFVVGELIGVLEQFLGSKTSGIEVGIFQIIIPLHERTVFGVPTHHLNGLMHHVHKFHTIDGNAVLGL